MRDELKEAFGMVLPLRLSKQATEEVCGHKPVYHTVRYITRRISYGGSRISFLTIEDS